MELHNATGMPAGYTLGMQPDGRELLVVVVKGTFTIPEGRGEPRRAAEQAPLFEADVFTGAPGVSAPLYESDYAPRKPRCDVLLNGRAYAPGGRAAERVTVSLRVGPIAKSFDVVGHRAWRTGALSTSATAPRPFVTMPISYDNAFGGVDRSHKNPKRHRASPTNPVGVGFHEKLDAEVIGGKPLPNTEELGQPVTSPRGDYRPMAFGPVGRSWHPRPTLAGTYDQGWLEDVFPFLPADFREDYYQAAPADQQMPHPRGGEVIVLNNLTPAGQTAFRLPALAMPVLFLREDGEETTAGAVIDTLVIEPDARRFLMTWRASLALRRNLLEISQVVAGTMSPGWHRARRLGKTYYRSLGALAEANRGDAE